MQSAEEMYQEINMLKDDHQPQIKVKKLNALLEIYPDFVKAHDELGAIYFQQKDYQNALIHLEKAVQIIPDNTVLQKNLGDFYYTVLSRSEDALTCYLKVLEINPEDIQTNFTAANLLLSMHRFEEARLLYEKILTMEPGRSDIQEILDKLNQENQKYQIQSTDNLYEKAQKQIQNDDTKGAINTLLDIINKNPQDSIAHNDLGVLRYQNGEIEKAQRHYEKAVKLNPENINFKKNLAEYYLVVKRDTIKALELYLSILEGHPYDIETLMVAAKISEKFGHIQNALVFYKAITDIEPWNLEASEKVMELE